MLDKRITMSEVTYCKCGMRYVTAALVKSDGKCAKAGCAALIAPQFKVGV